MKIRHLLTSLSLAALLFVGCAQTVSGDATGSVDASENVEAAECSDAAKECCAEETAEKAECSEAQKAEDAGCCAEGEGEAEIN